MLEINVMRILYIDSIVWSKFNSKIRILFASNRQQQSLLFIIPFKEKKISIKTYGILMGFKTVFVTFDKGQHPRCVWLHCVYRNKFEQVSSLGHQMSLAGESLYKGADPKHHS